MDQIASALGDSSRWRIVELLAERPRSVGELAELTGLRQPQTTKHLKTLVRAGFATMFPLGQRRVYAIEAEPLLALRNRLTELVEVADAHQDKRDIIARYQAALEAETAAADRKRWADGRAFSFERVIAASTGVIWRHWIEPDLLASWWAPQSMTITECGIAPQAGGRVVLEYRDAEGQYRSEGRVHDATAPEHLAFDLSVLDPAGSVSFKGEYDLALTEVPEGTRLRLGLHITETTVEAAPYIAGIETGWGQVLDNLADAVGASQQTTKEEEQQL